LGDDTIFLSGTDVNAKKTVLAAEKSGKDVQDYTNEVASIWKRTWEKLGISNDDFIRTTQSRHKAFVIDFFKKIEATGDFYKGRYEGLYCVGHEAFLKPQDLDEQGYCPDHKSKPEQIVEQNYFFKLSKYRDQLLKFLDSNPDFVQPKERFNEVYSFVKQELQDISITREGQKWGIPAPNDPNHVIYVWFDALINYMSAQPSRWPADLQIIGKDILRFHAVIWPAMLWSAGYPLPKKIFAHGFFTVDGVKISKSLGNVIDPLSISKKYGAEALRYYLFREIPFGADGDFSFDRLGEVYNSDLANGVGNLVARVAKLCETAGLEVKSSKTQAFDEDFKTEVENLRFQQGIALIWKKIANLDHLIDQSKPWELIKKDIPTARRTLEEDLVVPLRDIAFHLAPFLPETSQKIGEQFKGPKIKSEPALFPRIL
jgi:methionyl-tRNA synthetase